MSPWFFLFVLSIGGGGFFALLVALIRTPGVSALLPEGLFYHWLIGHVDLALIIGLLSFLVFLWHRVFEEHERVHEFALCYGGTFLIFLSALLGLGVPVHNNYVPTISHPVFFAGVLLFGIGYTLTSLRFLPIALRGILSKENVRGVLSVSVILSLVLSASLTISFLRTPPMEEVYLYFERLYWLPGHVHQFINACLLISSWLLLSDLSGRKVTLDLRLLHLLLIPFPLIYLLVQIWGKDPLSLKGLTTLGYAAGIGVPTLIYALLFLVKVAFRGGFYSNALGLSTLLYVVGASMGYLIVGSDLRIPAHYHGVIASILTSLMVLTYRYLMEFGKAGELPKLVKAQPYLYGSGMLLFVLGLFWSGYFGAPRKTPGTGYIESLEVYLFMILMGVGSVLSVVGGIIFVAFVLYSIIIIKGHGYGGNEEAEP